ncbi:MAG: hypothetical protein CMH58_08120 [Myxococcales bacterium]|nr:hypothetical protein [Myxococcales bacterium]
MSGEPIMYRLLALIAALLTACYELPPPKEPHQFPIRRAEGACKGRVCKPPVMPWMGPTSDLGDPNPWIDQPQSATEPAAQVPPECGEHTAFDPLHQRCRPVVGPRATCSSGPFATEHPWAQGTNPKRYVAVGGTGDGSSPDQAAPDATTALQGIDRQTNVTLLYGEGTFEEGLQLSGSGRVISLIGLCPERSHLSGGDQMAVHVEDVARLRVAGLHLSTSAPRSAEDSFREGALAVFGAGGIELSELFIESRYSLGITIYDVGERGVHLSNSRFGRTTVNSFAVITSAGPVSVRGSDFRGPNWGAIVNLSGIAGDVAVTYNYVGASASWGIVAGYVSGETEISHNEVAGPLGERGLYWYGDVQHTSPVNIRHNRFDQVGGTAILVIGGAGALDVAFNHIVGPIAQTSLLIGNRRSEETQRIYRNTIGWVGHSAIGLHSLRAPAVVEGNRIDGPVGSFGILGLETQETPRLDIVRNRVGQTGENAIQVTNVRNDVTIFQNNIVGPTGARGIFVYNEEPPEPAEEPLPTVIISANTVGDVSDGDGILVAQVAHEVTIENNDLKGPFSRAGISLISALGGGKVTNIEVGRAYEHGLYLGPSGNHPDRSPGGSWQVQDNRFLGPIGLDGICVLNAEVPDGGEIFIDRNEIGRASRVGIFANEVSGSVRVHDNTLLGPIGSDGIYMRHMDGDGTIEGNQILSGQATGISLRGEGTTGSWVVQTNEISNVLGRGILLYDLREETNVSVATNTIVGARGAGIYAWASTAPIQIQSNHLSRTRQAGFVDMVNGSPELVLFGYGVAALDVVSLRVANNTISDNHVGGLAVDHGEWGRYDDAPHLSGAVSVHIEDNALSGHPSHQEIGSEQNVVVQNRAGDMNITGVQGLGSMNPVGLEVPMCRNVDGAHQATGGGGF